MKVLGVDPGGTTGFCGICYDNESEQITVELFREVSLDLLRRGPTGELDAIVDWLHKKGRVQSIIAVESVVCGGRLTPGKIHQIIARDRISVISELTEGSVYEVTPEAVKRVQDVPSNIQGQHARDAYRVAVSFLRARESQL